MKKLVFEDRNAATSFEKAVTDSLNLCNNLIELYETFQDFKKIKIYEDWIELVTDPTNFYDQTIITGVSLQATGNKQPDPGVLASMFNIDRDSYLNLVAGKPVSEGCKPCQKMKIKKGQTAISLSSYLQFREYLIFEEGRFNLNTDAIEKHKDTFNVYLENPKQIEYYKHLTDLAKILNEHIIIGKLGRIQIEHLADMTGFQILDNKLILNNMKLATIIRYM